MAEELRDELLREKGLAALEREFGPVDALRFLSLVSREGFDYRSWRDLEFGKMSLSEILSQAIPSSADDNRSRYPLRGTPVKYEQPTEPVAEHDWEALQ